MRLGAPAHVTENVLEGVAAHYGIEVAQLRGPERTRQVSFARAVAVFIMHDQQGLAQAEIGRILGRDHSTVNYLLAQVRAALLVDDRLADDMLRIFNRACR